MDNINWKEIQQCMDELLEKRNKLTDLNRNVRPLLREKVELLEKYTVQELHEKGELANLAYKYIFYLTRQPNKALEPILFANDMHAIQYAKNIVNKRMPELEKELLASGHPYTLSRYARDVIRGRWKEAEHSISQGSNTSYHGYLNFLKENCGLILGVPVSKITLDHMVFSSGADDVLLIEVYPNHCEITYLDGRVTRLNLGGFTKVTWEPLT